MKAQYLNREELLKENRRLIRNLSKRAKNIEGLGFETTPHYAINQFKELKQNLPQNISELSTKELQTLNRDLNYINSLKTATVKGAKRTQEVFTPVAKWLNVISPEKKKEFFSVYDKLYSTYHLYSRFKYEIFGTTMVQQMQGQDLEKFVNDLIKFGEELEKEGKTITDEEFRVLFTTELQNL